MKWNPELIDITKKYYFWNKPSIIKHGGGKYQFLIFIWKNFLPSPIAGFIGPKIRKAMGI
jgi:hypothetical protein